MYSYFKMFDLTGCGLEKLWEKDVASDYMWLWDSGRIDQYDILYDILLLKQMK